MSEMAQRELPEGWKWVPLGNYVENHDAARIPISTKEREKRKGNFPYYGASGIIDSIDGFTHDGEFVLIGEDGANLLTRSKPIAFIAKGQFWVNNHAHVLKCKNDFSNAYFSYYINSIPLNQYVTGTAQPKLNQNNLNKILIPVASPDEQKRIVAKIEELFSHIDAGVDGLKKTQRLLKNLLIIFFTARLSVFAVKR